MVPAAFSVLRTPLPTTGIKLVNGKYHLLLVWCSVFSAPTCSFCVPSAHLTRLHGVLSCRTLVCGRTTAQNITSQGTPGDCALPLEVAALQRRWAMFAFTSRGNRRAHGWMGVSAWIGMPELTQDSGGQHFWQVCHSLGAHSDPFPT